MMKHIAASRARVALFVAAAFGAATLAVSAQTTAFNPPLAQRPMMKATAPTPTSDDEFARAAAWTNNAEIQESRLALQRSQNAIVRNFAQRMLDDHTTGAVQLQAATRGVGARPAPVMAVGPAARAEYDALVKAGSDFDAQYMLAQIPDHQNAVNAFTWESQNGKDASLRAYATMMLPIIAQHLRLAQTFVASNGASLGLNPDGSNAVINPPGRGPTGTTGSGSSNNPATGSSGGTQGQNSPTNPTQPQGAPAATPGSGIGGAGTPAPVPSGHP